VAAAGKAWWGRGVGAPTGLGGGTPRRVMAAALERSSGDGVSNREIGSVGVDW
jgi:hypothetical protein